MFRKKLSRGQLLSFLAAQPRAVVAMEACATAHDWGRAIAELGHEVRLALANKMARSVWAMLTKGETYQGSALTVV